MARVYDNEGYYNRLVELQDKLRKSEEERLKLEEKFNQMMRTAKDSEQMRLKQIRERYNQFLEEDRLRNDRNEKILRILNQIESRAAMLTAKTDRLRMLRRQYENYILKNSPIWKNKKTDNGVPNFNQVTYENHNPITQSQMKSTAPNVTNFKEYNTPQYANKENNNYNKSQVSDNLYFSNIQPSLSSAFPSGNPINYDGNTFENQDIDIQNTHKERMPIQQNVSQNLGQEHFQSGSVFQNSYEPLRNPFAKPFQTRAIYVNDPTFANSVQQICDSQPEQNQFPRVNQFQNYPDSNQKLYLQEENETAPISIQNLGIKTNYLNRADDNNRNRQSAPSKRPLEDENTNDLAVIREYLNKDKEEETPKMTLDSENVLPRKHTDRTEMYENDTNDTINLEKDQNSHDDITSCHGNEKKGMINNFDSNNLSEVQNVSHVDKISSGNDTVLQDQKVMGIMNLNVTDRDKKLNEMTVHPLMKSKIVHNNTEQQDNSDDVLFINANQGDCITELKAPTLESSESKPNLLFENEISRENIDISIAKDKIESDYSVHRNYAETELVEGERILTSDTKDKNNSERDDGKMIHNDVSKKSDKSSTDIIKPTTIENKDDQTLNTDEYKNISEEYVSKNKEENLISDLQQEAKMYQENFEKGNQPNEHQTELVPDQYPQEQQFNTELYKQELYPGESQQQYQNSSQEEEQQHSGTEQYQEQQQEYQRSEMQEGYDQQYTTDNVEQQYEQGVDGQYFQDENYSSQGQGSNERFDNYYEQGSYPQEYEQTTSQGYEQPTEQISEPIYNQTKDQNIDQGYKQSSEQTSEQAYEQTTGQIYDQSSQQAYDQTTGQLVHDQPYDQNADELYSQYDQTTGETYGQMYDPVAQQTYDQSNYDTSQYDHTGQEYIDLSQGQYVDPNQIYDPSQESAVIENVSELSADGQPIQYESQRVADPLIIKQLPPLSKMLDSDSESVQQPSETKPLSNDESDFDFSGEVTQ